MNNKLVVLKISLGLGLILFGCGRSPELKEKKMESTYLKKCTFSTFDGECNYYSNYTSCSMGTCKEGNCTNGKGVLTYPGGSRLEGIFKNGKINGNVKYYGCRLYSNNHEDFLFRFNGTMKDNLKMKGVYETIPGDYNENKKIFYVGQFKNEKRNGMGIYNDDSGNYYSGNWNDNIKNGSFKIFNGFKKEIDWMAEDENQLEKYFKESNFDSVKLITFINDVDKKEVDKQNTYERYYSLCISSIPSNTDFMNACNSTPKCRLFKKEYDCREPE